MMFHKFRTPVLGQFWLQIDLQDYQQSEQFAKGLVVGWSLGRKELFELVDTRLSRHPTELLRSIENIQEFLQQKEQEL